MAMASSDIQRFITVPNVSVHKATDSNARYFSVMDISRYKTSGNPITEVETKDGKAKFLLSQTVHKEAMYAKNTGVDGSVTSSRYRIIDGKVASITECRTTTVKGMIFDSSKHECVYMDEKYCEESRPLALSNLENGERDTLEGPVRINTIFPEGDKRKGDNYRARYTTHSNDAINGIKDVFGGEVVNLVAREKGVAPHEVTRVTRVIRKLCDELKTPIAASTNTSGVPEGPAAQ